MALGIGKSNARALRAWVRAWALLFPSPRANNHFDQDPSVIMPYYKNNTSLAHQHLWKSSWYEMLSKVKYQCRAATVICIMTLIRVRRFISPSQPLIRRFKTDNCVFHISIFIFQRFIPSFRETRFLQSVGVIHHQLLIIQ